MCLQFQSRQRAVQKELEDKHASEVEVTRTQIDERFNEFYHQK